VQYYVADWKQAKRRYNKKRHNFENWSRNIINSKKMQFAGLSSEGVGKASKGSGRDDEDDERKSPSLAGSKRNASSEDDYDEDDRSESDENDEKEQGDSSNTNELSRVRREKRLAMNRSSARARRKRKKTLLDTLANQLTDITKRNQTFQRTNDTLRARVEQLESALAQAQATISTLVVEARPSLQHHQQLGATGTSLNAASQESIRSLLLAAAPALNPTPTTTASAVFSLGDQLLSAQAVHLLGRQIGQQNRGPALLEAAGLGGLRYHPDLLRTIAFLGQGQVS
jgi:hypothetical protein